MLKNKMGAQWLICGLVLIGFVILLGTRHPVPGALYTGTIIAGIFMIGVSGAHPILTGQAA